MHSCTDLRMSCECPLLCTPIVTVGSGTRKRLLSRVRPNMHDQVSPTLCHVFTLVARVRLLGRGIDFVPRYPRNTHRTWRHLVVYLQCVGGGGMALRSATTTCEQDAPRYCHASYSALKAIPDLKLNVSTYRRRRRGSTTCCAPLAR